MTENLRPSISVFTELTDIWRDRPVRPFLLAWLAGTLAGGGPMLVFTLPMLENWTAEYPLMSVWIAFLPVWIASAITLASMLAIGLPATVMLRHFQHESLACYTKLGLVFGALVPSLIGLALFRSIEPLPFFAIPGILAALACAQVWGRWRCAIHPAAAERRDDNPFHDLIH